jgi:hypothetical protein
MAPIQPAQQFGSSRAKITAPVEQEHEFLAVVHMLALLDERLLSMLSLLL